MSDSPTVRGTRSAAVVLLFDRRGRVLLVERAPELRFFGGYLALPGGVRDRADGPDDPGGGDLTALSRCARRELFEETGILLGGPRLTRETRDALRRSLLDGSATSDPRWDQGELTVLCRFLTPPFAPVRYDTQFFTTRLPDGEEASVWPGELVGGRFWSPAEALAAWRRGEVLIAPPVLLLLELLADAGLGGLAERAAALADGYAAGKLHRVQFSPGIVMASLRTPTLPPATTTNCLIVGTDRLFLIDPATPHADQQERLFELCDELRAEGRELEGILLTHHHPDHVGAARATAARYGLPVHAHELTLARLASEIDSGRPIADGDSIELGTAPDGSDGWRLVALFTPGHDRGHLCFSESRYRALIAGDMISTVSTIIIDPPEGDLGVYLQSLERLLRTPVDTLYPAHGPAVRDGHRIVRHYVRHRAQRENALLEALAAGAARPADLVPLVYSDIDPALYALAERSLLAGLYKLRDEGRAVEADGMWR